MKNLAGDPAYKDIREELAERLRDELTKEADPRMTGEGPELDQYPYAAENSRDFYRRYMAGEEMTAGWVNQSDFEAAKLD